MRYLGKCAHSNSGQWEIFDLDYSSCPNFFPALKAADLMLLMTLLQAKLDSMRA